MAAPVDIIVPVYRGEAETRACLASVLASRSATPAEIVVVDDAGPEPALREWLRSLRDEGRITLLEHEANRGFVASVNEGMRLNPERDVVLLNSDTEVAGDWLDRLARHAARDTAVGTVTPFSGNATICSYPRTLVSNPLPTGEDTRSLDAAFAAANSGRSVDIPTAVGFCMYINRRCLAEVGLFDEDRFGRGYGEEVDFCMRAARAGFHHVLAGDVYVRHIGEVSFGSDGAGRRQGAQAVIDRLYPEFQAQLRPFLASDPPRMLRRRADLERLRRATLPRELFLASDAQDAACASAAAIAAGDCEPLLLEPQPAGGIALRWMRSGEELALFIPAGLRDRSLHRALGALGVSAVNVSNATPLGSGLAALARDLDWTVRPIGERAKGRDGGTRAVRRAGPPLAEIPRSWLWPGPGPRTPRSALGRLLERLRSRS